MCYNRWMPKPMAKQNNHDLEDVASVLVEITKAKNKVLETSAFLAELHANFESIEEIVRKQLAGKIRLAVVRIGDRRRTPRE